MTQTKPNQTPLRPKSGRRQTGETAAPHPPGEAAAPIGGGGGAPRLRRAPPPYPHAPALPATERRRTGGAQDGANGPAPSGAGQGKAGARTRARRSLPPSLPPPGRTDPLAADRAAPDAHGCPAIPTARVYAGEAHRRRRMAGRLTGRGGGGRRSAPPPCSPPSFGAAGTPTPHPPGAEGTPPLPPEGTATRGRGGAAGPTHRAPQRHKPPAPAGVAADGGARTSVPERRADHARGRHAAVHQTSTGAAPPMTRASPVAPTMLPRQGGQREVSGLKGPPGEWSTGRPPLPARQAAPGARGGPATPTKRARRGGMRGRREGGQYREPRAAPQRGRRRAAARPPPQPPRWHASCGGAGPQPPEAGGMIPPSPLARPRRP